jgi:quercetin dioxygenase-like cupin family protein
MARYVTVDKQNWQTADVVGVQMQGCVLWEGQHNVFSGLFRMTQGMCIPMHRHAQWVQILVLNGKMQIESATAEVHTIGPGEYYFVEPGDAHIETALEDTLLLVVADEERGELRRESPIF